MTDMERTKVIMNVIKHSLTKNRSELSMQMNKTDQRGKCYLCGNKNHEMKKCWHFKAGKSIEENKKNAEAKIKERAKKKKNEMEKKDAEKVEKEMKEETPTMHKKTIVQMPHPRIEQTSMALVTELSSKLYCEPCNLVGVA